VLKNTNPFPGIFQPKIKPTQNKIATRIVPELKGIPKLLTVKISVLAKKAIVKGNSSLKINSNTDNYYISNNEVFNSYNLIVFKIV
jgi:hypothetical protein